MAEAGQDSVRKDQGKEQRTEQGIWSGSDTALTVCDATTVVCFRVSVVHACDFIGTRSLSHPSGKVRISVTLTLI